MMKRFLILLFALLLTAQSISAAVPAYSPNFGNAMAGVIQQKVAAQGFAANDPRFIATQTALGSALTGIVTAGAVAAGAPLWATVLVGAAAAGAVALGIGALTNWLFNNDGTVTVPSGAATGPGSGLCYQIGGLGCFSSITDALMNGDSISNNYADGSDQDGEYSHQFAYNYGPVPGWSTLAVTRCRANGCGLYHQISGHITTTVYSSRPPVINIDPGSAPLTAPLAAAAAGVPSADLSLPVNPYLLAEAINTGWQAAASQPEYGGLPFQSSNPVTAADVEAWQASNPAAYPTVGDMLSPAVNPSTGTVAQPVAPGTVATGTQTNPASSQPLENLGPDPNVPLPMLEGTPTAQMILNPLLNLFPSLKAFVVPPHSAECPKPSMSLFGRALLLDGHCNLLESIRPTLYAVMAAVWVVVALFIILAA